MQILQFRAQNLVFSCLPKAISNRSEDIHKYYSGPPLPVQILQFRVQNLVFSCLPEAISNRRYSQILFLPTPASADSPISCAKLGVFMPSQSHFKQKIFTYIIPAHPCQCRFSNFMCKTWCFHAFPKPFQIEDIHIYYSCPPLPVQILQFCVQNLVFSCLPKAISNRRYSHILFLPTPASADSPILCAKLGVFMPSQSHFK